MSAQAVNVLAILDDHIEGFHAFVTSAKKGSLKTDADAALAELRAARNAVEELIGAAAHKIKTNRAKSLTVRQSIAADDRLAVALNACGGAQ